MAFQISLFLRDHLFINDNSDVKFFFNAPNDNKKIELLVEYSQKDPQELDAICKNILFRQSLINGDSKNKIINTVKLLSKINKLRLHAQELQKNDNSALAKSKVSQLIKVAGILQEQMDLAITGKCTYRDFKNTVKDILLDVDYATLTNKRKTFQLWIHNIIASASNWFASLSNDSEHVADTMNSEEILFEKNQERLPVIINKKLFLTTSSLLVKDIQDSVDDAIFIGTANRTGIFTGI